MKHYFLGLAAGNKRGIIKQLFTHARGHDVLMLEKYLSEKYGGAEAIATKNGRSGLAIALKTNFNKGDKIIINGFTCYAVVEAVKAAGMEPVFADISRKDLNFTIETVEKAWKEDPKNIKGIIIQNSFGNPVDIKAILKFARLHDLRIIEDMAHCVGVKYANGHEAGTVGSAAVFSFGKDKSIDTVSGGAVVLKRPVQKPHLRAHYPDSLRARFYPLLGAICRVLSYVHLNGAFMALLLKLHWVEKSADNKLDTKRKIAPFEAKVALWRFKNLKTPGVNRKFYLVRNRDEVLKKLHEFGYYFDGFWYEKPVSPERYYKKVNFPEDKCPVAVEVASQIINFPTFYKKKDLALAEKIIKPYLVGDKK